MTGRPRSNHASGRLAEGLAVWWLRLRGYRVLARRYRTPVGEIDILARRGGLLVAVEVKKRAAYDIAAAAIAPRQWQRVARALDWVLASDAGRTLQGRDIRFDAILIVPGRLPTHVRDAWRP